MNSYKIEIGTDTKGIIELSTDEIKCNHNRSKLLAVVAMTMKAECRGYFNIRSKK